MSHNCNCKPKPNYEEVFADVPLLCPRKHVQRFYPSFTGFTSLINDIHYRLIRMDRDQKQIMPVEALRYYGACLFWLRVIKLKDLFDVQLTEEEDELYFFCSRAKLTIPEPLFLGLQAIRKITTKTGVVFEPTFPPLATKCINGIPGSYGVVDEENHHWYEDYPVIGPAYEALVQKASDQPTESQYASVFAPPNLKVNFNLQGYGLSSSMTKRQNVNYLKYFGVVENILENIKNTGFSPSIIRDISDDLSRRKAFRNFNFSDLTIDGNIAQMVEAHPDLEDYKENVAAADQKMRMHCCSKESQMEVGISAVYGLNLWKENLKCSEPWEQVRPWSCVQFTESNQPSEKWISERNKYRNIPACFQAENFYSMSFDVGLTKYAVVSSLCL